MSGQKITIRISFIYFYLTIHRSAVSLKETAATNGKFVTKHFQNVDNLLKHQELSLLQNIPLSLFERNYTTLFVKIPYVNVVHVTQEINFLTHRTNKEKYTSQILILNPGLHVFSKRSSCKNNRSQP